MFTLSRLDALQDLPQLISDLSKLVINFFTEVLMLLLKASNLLFKPIDAFMVNVFGHDCARLRDLLSSNLGTLGHLAFPFPFRRWFVGNWSEQHLKCFLIDLH